MNIRIMSEKDIAGKSLDAYVISFHDKGEEPPNFKCIRSCFVEFDDLEIDECTETPDVSEAVALIYEARKNNKDIICQCRYGQSRSAGCAAAIEEFINNNGIAVFADYKYWPNKVVYHTVFDALNNA